MRNDEILVNARRAAPDVPGRDDTGTGDAGMGGAGSRTPRLCLALLAILLTSGCLGDPPPAPGIAPLEIVIGSSTRPEEPCLLNRSEVGAGTHEVTVIAESGPASIRILDGTGAVLLKAGSTEGKAGEPHSVRLSVGTHTVECTPAGGPLTTATLLVVPPA